MILHVTIKRGDLTITKAIPVNVEERAEKDWRFGYLHVGAYRRAIEEEFVDGVIYEEFEVETRWEETAEDMEEEDDEG